MAGGQDVEGNVPGVVQAALLGEQGIVEGAGPGGDRAQCGGSQSEGLAQVADVEQADAVTAGRAVLHAHAFQPGDEDQQEGGLAGPVLSAHRCAAVSRESPSARSSRQGSRPLWWYQPGAGFLGLATIPSCCKRFACLTTQDDVVRYGSADDAVS